MTDTDLVEAMRSEIERDWRRWRSRGRDDEVTLYPDEPASDPFPAEVMVKAIEGLPYVAALTRFTRTRAVPFDGWQIAFKR